MDRDSKSKWTICQRIRKIFVTRNNVSRSPKSNLQLSRFDTLKTDVENPEGKSIDFSVDGNSKTKKYNREMSDDFHFQYPI